MMPLLKQVFKTFFYTLHTVRRVVPMSLVLAKINLFFPQHGLLMWVRELCINTVLLKLTLCVQFPHGGASGRGHFPSTEPRLLL